LPSKGKLAALSTSEYSKTPPNRVRRSDELIKLLEIGVRFAGKAHDEAGAQGNTGIVPRMRSSISGRRHRWSALHAGKNIAAGVLQRHVNVLGQARMGRKRVEKFLGDAVGIGVQKRTR